MFTAPLKFLIVSDNNELILIGEEGDVVSFKTKNVIKDRKLTYQYTKSKTKLDEEICFSESELKKYLDNKTFIELQ